MQNTFQIKAQVGSSPLVTLRVYQILSAHHDLPFSRPIHGVTRWYDIVPALRGDLWVKLHNVWKRDITSMSDDEFLPLLSDVSLMAQVEGCLFAIHRSLFFNALDPRPFDQDLIGWLAGKLGRPPLDKRYRITNNPLNTQVQERVIQGTVLNDYLGTYLWRTAESLFADLPLEAAVRASMNHVALEFNRDQAEPITVEKLIEDAQEDGRCATPSSFDDGDMVDAYTSRVDGLEPITDDIFPNP